jgi:hypothetical protein
MTLRTVQCVIDRAGRDVPRRPPIAVIRPRQNVANVRVAVLIAIAVEAKVGEVILVAVAKLFAVIPNHVVVAVRALTGLARRRRPADALQIETAIVSRARIFIVARLFVGCLQHAIRIYARRHLARVGRLQAITLVHTTAGGP